MAIDTHMHINKTTLQDPLKPIRKIYANPNLEAVINVGLNYETSEEAVILSTHLKKFYAAIGIHPLYTENQNIDNLYQLATNRKVVAIGEIGLDTTKPNFDEQKKYLIAQIALANELQLPVIIHANNANKDIVHIFKNIIRPHYGCVFHCFQPDEETLYYLIDQGYYISFAGRITYKTANKSHDMIRLVPNDLFIVETDAPFITPVPFKGTENESSYITYIIKKISEVKNMTYEEVELITTENAKGLFKRLK